MLIDVPRVYGRDARGINAVIGLERPERGKLRRNECLSFKLRSNPEEAASPIYELTVCIFSSGTTEELLIFKKNL